MTLRVLEPPAGSAMAKAFLQIQMTCGEGRRMKERLRNYIDKGTGHPSVCARYGARCRQLRSASAETACIMLKQWRREERKAFAIAEAFGQGTRYPTMVLREMLIMAKVARNDPVYSKHFGAVVKLIAYGLD